MIVAVGTKRRPKLEAVKSVFTEIGTRHPEFTIDELLARDVPSGTRETPFSLDHLIEGSYNRVQALREQLRSENLQADILLGLEGGVHKLSAGGCSHAFLQSWVYVEYQDEGYFGSSGNLPLPKSITEAVFQHRRSLGNVIDEFSGKSRVRDQEGTFGILTEERITRQQSFETALLSALTPLYNRRMYDIELAGAK